MKRTFRESPFYKAALWLVLCGGLLFLVLQSADIFMSPAFLQADDFVQYWAAGRLNLLGGNPYDPEQLLPLQRQAGRTDYVSGAATIVWNPPWVMPLLMPFAALRYPIGRVLWFLASFAALAACSLWTWRRYGGPERSQWVAWAVAFTFMPALIMLRVGQIGVFLLVGVAGVLHAATQHQWVRLGAWVIVLSIKPQLVYLLLVVLLLWLVERRQFVPVLSGMGVLALAGGVTLIVNPRIIGQYLEALTAYPPVAWATPTLGSVLRLLLGLDKFWLPLIPTLGGLVWAVLYWRRRRHSWDWETELPLLLFVSLLTTLYTWTYDLVLLILPIVALLARWFRQKSVGRAKPFLLVYIALCVVMFIVQRWELDDFWFVWVSPVLLAWYLWARTYVKQMTLRAPE
ncbi:MAG TPA: glycosyltransferase family 87 protein [Anaerolineae bacterium]|nr:glycosyltransferase family 87 protein [Anaerolineae bacterium]HQH38821.1 glycosyltransferase family 87 protein [Anaerolineae bacterium]